MELFPKLVLDLGKYRRYWHEKGLEVREEEDARGQTYLVLYRNGRRTCRYHRTRHGNWGRRDVQRRVAG